MTLCELLRYVNENSSCEVLDGSCEETLQKAMAGTHKDSFNAAVVVAVAGGALKPSADALITRAEATTSLGPIRLRAMRDDAPVADLRRVEQIVHAIDGAFNEEALALRGSR